ncbi:MAG: hypothetical protein WBM04_09520 [Candidatus Korobacteraceae bacterium]
MKRAILVRRTAERDLDEQAEYLASTTLSKAVTLLPDDGARDLEIILED